MTHFLLLFDSNEGDLMDGGDNAQIRAAAMGAAGFENGR
jgi:hypothetical protein